MQNFKLIKFIVDPRPFPEEIYSVDGARDESTGRRDKIAVQREALAIPLRGLRKSAINGHNRRDLRENRRTTGSMKYPKVGGLYHFVLLSTVGAWLKAEDEEVRMREGELWWFDNNKMREAHNDGEQDRIHMIFDMLPSAMAEQVPGIAS